MTHKRHLLSRRVASFRPTTRWTSRRFSARNIFCANPACRSGFNATPRGGQVLFCHRIAKSGEERYPPLVHILVAGYPACRFTTDVPIDWPIGHWLGPDEVEAEITCPV